MMEVLRLLVAVALSVLCAGLGACRDVGEDPPAAPDAAAPAGDAGTADAGGPGGTPWVDRVLLTGTLLTPGGPLEGELLVEGNLITCVAASCRDAPGAAGAYVLETGGIVSAGLVDAHDHGLFNVFDESDWTPEQLYGNHNQWTNETRYGEVVDAKQYLAAEMGSPVDVRCELAKYGETKALIAGTTSFLMAPGTSRACFASFIRTIDTPHNDLGRDSIQTSISVPATTAAEAVCANFADGDTLAYVVHVAEGVDATARNELATLAGRAGGCLMAPQTTIVHGTALEADDFALLASAGMSLVWSPRSNLFLYGATTRIDLAIAAGVETIALAPDWALGGSVNLLEELRAADAVDASDLGDILSPRRLHDMVTIDAARALAADDLVGSLEVGKRADVAVFTGLADGDPYEALLAARPEDVSLVLVDGRPLYGDAALLPDVPADAPCDALDVCGEPKFLCAAEASTADLLDQTFADVVSILEAELASYDAAVEPLGIASFSPLAPLTRCP